ncbi:hypothetical protein [Cupriavidus plantarum]|uniref:hypothetical protein n=1 Tax=Cupriavidus plantarum TaxID=942865 RepID=UPI001BADA3E9|nr:hypothetical protein [Cupriavidus plantarum]
MLAMIGGGGREKQIQKPVSCIVTEQFFSICSGLACEPLCLLGPAVRRYAEVHASSPENPMDRPPRPTTQHIDLAAGQVLRTHLPRGAVLHVAAGRITLRGAPAWHAETVLRGVMTLGEGAAEVAADSGWVTIEAARVASLRLIRPPSHPWWSALIKSRLGRSGLLPGNSWPPDTQADVSSGPHATNQRSKTRARP